jgi:hypothetical protein
MSDHVIERLRMELQQAGAELRAHLGSWEYAFAMGAGCHSGSEHPVHWETRARTEKLQDRVRRLRARLAEYEL